ncbi:hypothetical protein BHE74_00050949 [Ensete ventricosum]|nr:hypothetical protein BHE74_00050949 [Ensete ventricosum]
MSLLAGSKGRSWGRSREGKKKRRAKRRGNVTLSGEAERGGEGGCTTGFQRWRERDGYLWSIQRGREREDWTPPEGGEGWKEGEGDGDTAALYAPRRDD